MSKKQPGNIEAFGAWAPRRGSTELGGMWQTNPTTGLRVRVKVGHHLGRLNAQARLTRLAVEQSWQHQAERMGAAERLFKNLRGAGFVPSEVRPVLARDYDPERRRLIRARLKASQRARKVGGLAF